MNYTKEQIEELVAAASEIVGPCRAWVSTGEGFVRCKERPTHFAIGAFMCEKHHAQQVASYNAMRREEGEPEYTEKDRQGDLEMPVYKLPKAKVERLMNALRLLEKAP